jgi:raffinose/stachyose/melibiose transport system permease protein
MSDKSQRGVFRYIVLSLGAIISLFPFLWVLVLSFKTKQEFFAQPFALPESIDLVNYKLLLGDQRIIGFLQNSFFVSIVSVLVVVSAATLAAYALARIDFPGSQALFILFLIGDTIPLFVVLIPLFIFIQSIGLSGTWISLIMPYAAMNMGLSVFILRGFFSTVVKDLEDAARIDGCNSISILIHIMLPVIRPGVVVVAIINFIIYWNEYFLVQVLMPTQRMFTLPAGMASLFVGRFGTNWPIWGAGIIISILPTVVLFASAQEKIVQGWTFSGK